MADAEERWDALGRLLTRVRPEGIRVDYEYDGTSRLLAYRDALGNETRWDYDELGRRTRTQYPDGTVERFAHDPAGHVVQIVDPRGNVIAQSFDPAGRLSARTIDKAEGVAGPSAESYAYDALGRLKRAQSGAVATEMEYDSLGRLLAESMGGRRVTYRPDLVGNVTELGYPSGERVVQGFDALDRPAAIGTPADPTGIATYAYRGPDLVAGKTLGGALAGELAYDGARRLASHVVRDPQGQAVLSERLAWSPRNLKVGMERGDLGGTGLAVGYDGAGRVREAARVANPLALAPPDSAPDPAALAQTPSGHGYAYDPAENLLRRVERRDAVPEVVELPLDSSGRNRPGQIGDVPVAWDPAGNLVARGERRFEYDWRNRLTRVTTDDGTEIASYTYDAFNRRVARTAGGATEETVWAGWQALEVYAGGQLAERRTHGLGLDEVVRLEKDLTGDGTLDQTYIPHYDSTGSLAVVTDAQGKVIERYDYSPYGARTIRVDSTAPKVEQLRIVEGDLWLEISEEVLPEPLEEALAAGALRLVDEDADEPVTLTSVHQPVQDGRQARRRVIVTTTDPPAAGTQVRFTLPAGALQDLFGNRPNTDFEHTFNWPEEDQVVFDETPPRLSQVALRDRHLEIEMSEEPDLASAQQHVTLSGVAVTWTLTDDRYTLRTEDPLPGGSHTVTIGSDLEDLAGLPLGTTYTFDFQVPATPPSGDTISAFSGNELIFEAPDPREVTTSTILNSLGFHGLDHDPATGLVYVRNRWYDPEMGRFVTADPAGYVDGPSLYAFALYNPLNFRDPLGLETKAEWQQIVRQEIESRHGLNLDLWIPERGLRHNAPFLEAVYDWYSQVFLENPAMVWAGMARMAGGTVLGGLRQASRAATATSLTPHPGAPIARELARGVEVELLQMNKDVFDDLAWQHRAYLDKGIAELEERVRANEMTPENLHAWRLIDRGIAGAGQQFVFDGNRLLLMQEQEGILRPGYQRISRMGLGSVSALMSWMAPNPIPGGQSLREFYGWRSGRSIADFDDRWHWIMETMWPLWTAMPVEEQRRLVRLPLERLAEREFD